MAIQLDQKSLLYRDFRPVLELLTPLSERSRALRERLLAWDGTMAPGSRRRPWSSPSGTRSSPGFPPGRWARPIWDEPRYLLKALKHGGPQLRPAGDGVPAKACLDYAGLALEKALDRKEALRARTWGEVHRASFPHAVLTHTPLKRLTDREVAFGGDRYTVNVGPFDPETLRHGPTGPATARW